MLGQYPRWRSHHRRGSTTRTTAHCSWVHVWDPKWLRELIHDHTAKALTVEVHEVHVRDVSMLLPCALSAMEPIRYKGELRWRVNDKCVEIDTTNWHVPHHAVLGLDWSARTSGHQ